MSAAKCTGGRVQGSGFRVQGSGIGIQGAGAWSIQRMAMRGSVLRTQYLVQSTQYRNISAMVLAWCLGLALGTSTRSCAAEPSTLADHVASLAAKCDELGLKEQAAITRGWMIQRHSGRQYLFLPAVNDPAAPKVGALEAAKQWHKKFLELRREQAAALFGEAKTASDQNQPARAYQRLHEVLREDPDHSQARRILGYVKSGNDWRLPDWEKMVPRQPPLDHPKLPWRARGYWSLETPHFRIVTNHSKPELVEAGQQLENLHTLWRQIFFRYWSSAEALAARFAGGNEPLARERPKMEVVLFKTRQEYAAQVAAAHSKATTTLGLYDDKQRIAYFYGGDTSVY